MEENDGGGVKSGSGGTDESKYEADKEVDVDTDVEMEAEVR